MTDDAARGGAGAGGVLVPPLATAWAACRYVLRRWGLFLAHAGVWALFVDGIHYVQYAIGWGPESGPPGFWFRWLEMAVLAVAETRIAVLWCRSVLLGEAVPGLRALRFGWREIEFLQLAFPVLLLAWLLGLLAAVGVKAAIPAGTIMAGSVLPDRPPLLSDLACLFVLSLVLGRFVLGFPMAASDRLGGALRASWHLTRGNAWRLAGGWRSSCSRPRGCNWPSSI